MRHVVDRIEPLHLAVAHFPRRLAVAAAQLRQHLADVDEFESAVRSAQQLRDDRFVLDRVEAARAAHQSEQDKKNRE